MNSQKLSVTIVTLNEEKNLERCISSVRGLADEIIVVDSGSTDRTVKIAEALGAKVFENAWKGYGEQKNFAHLKCSSNWVLNLDADEEVSPALKEEIRQIVQNNSDNTKIGYSVPRLTWYLGRWIRHGGWYPNRLVRLSQKNSSQWSEPCVHEALIVQGTVGELKSDLLHYPFLTISDQIDTNLRYSKLGTEALRKKGRSFSLLKIIIKPIGKFFETYFIKAGFLDGVPGFIISVNATHSIFLKYANLLEVENQKEPFHK